MGLIGFLRMFTLPKLWLAPTITTMIMIVITMVMIVMTIQMMTIYDFKNIYDDKKLISPSFLWFLLDVTDLRTYGQTNRLIEMRGRI